MNLGFLRKVLLFRLRLLILYPLMLALGLAHMLAAHFGWRVAAALRFHSPRLLARLFLRLNGVRVQVQGFEQLERAPPVSRILFCNHNSRLDAYALLATCPVPFKSFWSSTAHVTTEGMSVVQWLGRALDLFFVHDKRDARVTAREFRRAEEYVAAGNTLSLFPEGTISQDGRIHRFGEACAKLAQRSNAVVVPTVILGSAALFEKRGQVSGGHVIRLIMLQPRRVVDLDSSGIREFMAELIREMNEVIERESCVGQQVVHLLV